MKYKKKVLFKKKKNGEDIFVSLLEVVKMIKVVKRVFKVFVNKLLFLLEIFC